jgi:hypothetical protein
VATRNKSLWKPLAVMAALQSSADAVKDRFDKSIRAKVFRAMLDFQIPRGVTAVCAFGHPPKT